jgi:GAF domain-containing protein
MAALAEVGRDISATLDLTAVLERIAGHARDLLDVSNSAVFLPDEERETMKAVVALGPIAGQVRATRVRRGEGIVGDLWQRREAQFVNDAAHDPRAVTIAGTERRPDDRTMVAPLLAGERVTGMMAVWRSGGDAFGEQDLAFLQDLARQASIAIENARLYSEAQAARAAAENAQAAAEEARAVAEAANESKSAFLANVSHELRTPLTSVMAERAHLPPLAAG